MLVFMGNQGKIGVQPAGHPMSPEEFRQALDALDLSQQAVAVMMGASPRTGQKWALGETRIPGSVALLLRLLVTHPFLLPVVHEIGAPPVRARSDTGKKTGKG